MSDSRHQSSHSSTLDSASVIHRVLGTIPAAAVQMVCMHPLDTVAKRKMKAGKVASVEELNKVIFSDQAGASYANRFASLYRGFANGFIYKIGQSTLKFTAQPVLVREIKNSDINGVLRNHLPENSIVPAINAIAGASVGTLEVPFLLPLDLAKIRQQNNPIYRGKTATAIIKEEFALRGLQGPYKSSLTTLARNIPGSAALFCVPAAVYSALNIDKSSASVFMLGAANVSGSFASLVISHPQDIIKVRKQSSIENPGAAQVIKDIFLKEGARGFAKGLGIKLFSQIPKLTLVTTLSDVFTRSVQSFQANQSPRLFSHPHREMPEWATHEVKAENSKRPG